MRFSSFLTAISSLALGASAYWLEDIKHQGLAPYAGNNYTVFRNVKDFGAVGDGSTDDTEAITQAMNAPGNRCMQGCASTTETIAVVYFPAGTYLLSSSLITPYSTQMIGDPTDRPVLKASPDFEGFGLIDGNPYYSEDPNWVTVNVFFRQVHNFVIDTTAIAPGTAATGMHWPSSQATSLQNIEFNMAEGDNSVHVGLFIESGSGGFMSDLTFNGGASGASLGNQQYTMRNFTFNNCKTAITQIWNWGWTYMGLKINNCDIGINMGAGKPDKLEVGSLNVIDASVSNTGTFIAGNYTENSSPIGAGGVMLENIKFESVEKGVTGANDQVYLEGGSKTVAAWGQGHSWEGAGNGTKTFQGEVTPNSRPAALMDGDNYLTLPFPRYSDLTADDFISVRTAGAVGDAQTDDTQAIQSAIDDAVSQNKVVFIDYGLYVVKDTINVPAGARITGESFPVIMGNGASFNDQTSPKAVFKIGSESGEQGRVELSNFIVSTKGPAAGAIVVEYNLAAPEGNPSGMWEFHTRIGGFSGSDFLIDQCLKVEGSDNIDENCIASYLAVHATPKSSGLYMENTWIWTADHDIEDNKNTQITLYSGRGIYIESTVGSFWLVGGASEHFHLYNYQFANTKNIFASMLQTETPYYQPIPDAIEPFTVNAELNDPDFEADCQGVEGNCADAWGVRIIESSDIFIYGAGLYSFFNNYDTSCNSFQNGSDCQTRILNIDSASTNINFFLLNTVGTTQMATLDLEPLAFWEDHKSTYPANLMMVRKD